MRDFGMPLAGVAFVSAAVSSNSDVTLFEQITAEVAAERISQCGLGPVTIRYDELLQSEVLAAALATSVTDDQLACADKAASYYDLELPAAVQLRYDAIRQERFAAHHLAQAKSWLSDRGLLERVPKYEPGVTDDETFTRQLEDLCGPRAKGAFQSRYGFHAISPDWVLRSLQPIERGAEVLDCLTNMAAVAGYKVYFIGNEATAKEG